MNSAGALSLPVTLGPMGYPRAADHQKATSDLRCQ